VHSYAALAIPRKLYYSILFLPLDMINMKDTAGAAGSVQPPPHSIKKLHFCTTKSKRQGLKPLLLLRICGTYGILKG
jgi:hypothetical protein